MVFHVGERMYCGGEWRDNIRMSRAVEAIWRLVTVLTVVVPYSCICTENIDFLNTVYKVLYCVYESQ